MAFKDNKNRTYDSFMNDKSYAREIITSFYKSHPALSNVKKFNKTYFTESLVHCKLSLL